MCVFNHVNLNVQLVAAEIGRVLLYARHGCCLVHEASKNEELRQLVPSFLRRRLAVTAPQRGQHEWTSEAAHMSRSLMIKDME